MNPIGEAAPKDCYEQTQLDDRTGSRRRCRGWRCVVSVTDDTAASDSETATTSAPETTTAPETTSGPDTTSAPSSTAGLDGGWVIDQSNSFAGYRIGEELANIGTVTAVGRTSNVEASLQFAGSQVTPDYEYHSGFYAGFMHYEEKSAIQP